MEKLVSALLAVSMFFAPFQQKIVTQKPTHTICVDAGHGGDDSGAINGDLSEAGVTLDIAKRLEKLLEDNNFGVIMTRTDADTNPTNSDRAAICNKHAADLALSIHLNSSEDTTLDYTQGLYGTTNIDKKFADALHTELVKDLGIADHGSTDFEDNFLLKTQMPATLQETVFLSNATEYQELTDGTGNKQQQIAQALLTGINTWFSDSQK